MIFPISAASFLVRCILAFMSTYRDETVYDNGDRRTILYKKFLGRTYLVHKTITVKRPPRYPMTADEIEFMHTLARFEKRLFMRAMKKKYSSRAI